MKRLIIAQALALFMVCSVFPRELRLTVNSQSAKPSSEKRVALVIGNSGYKDAPLLNPANDANDMTHALTALGFEVLHKVNLTRVEMLRAIHAFGESTSNADVALFYYAGHGVQVDGRNWLIPIGADVSREYEVEYEAVDVGRVLDAMQAAKSQLNIVILDACRSNPFAQSFRSVNRGLAVMNAPAGTLIAYSTAPGGVASDGDEKNGLYTRELLKAMQTAGLRIEEVFKQVRIAIQKKTEGKQIPWESSSLTGDFSFVRLTRAKGADVEQTMDADKATETNDAGDKLEIVSIEPSSPATLAIANDVYVVVKIAYELKSSDRCQIWAIPMVDNRFHPAGTYAPSYALQEGKGVIIRSFHLKSAGWVDHIFIEMKNGDRSKTLVSLKKEVRYHFLPSKP
jgi:hypothetical protein